MLLYSSLGPFFKPWSCHGVEPIYASVICRQLFHACCPCLDIQKALSLPDDKTAARCAMAIKASSTKTQDSLLSQAGLLASRTMRLLSKILPLSNVNQQAASLQRQASPFPHRRPSHPHPHHHTAPHSQPNTGPPQSPQVLPPPATTPHHRHPRVRNQAARSQWASSPSDNSSTKHTNNNSSSRCHLRHHSPYHRSSSSSTSRSSHPFFHAQRPHPTQTVLTRATTVLCHC